MCPLSNHIPTPNKHFQPTSSPLSLFSLLPLILAQDTINLPFIQARTLLVSHSQLRCQSPFISCCSGPSLNVTLSSEQGGLLILSFSLCSWTISYVSLEEPFTIFCYNSIYTSVSSANGEELKGRDLHLVHFTIIMTYCWRLSFEGMNCF